jgi:hypothetical protein
MIHYKSRERRFAKQFWQSDFWHSDFLTKHFWQNIFCKVIFSRSKSDVQNAAPYRRVYR